MKNNRLRIEGGVPLKGKVVISGAKNAALVLVAASIMAEGETILDNVPDIEDINVLIEILRKMDVQVHWNEDHSLSIQAPDRMINKQAPAELTRKLRASNLLLGSMMGRQNEATISLPGGCAIGERPMDLHVKGIEALGAAVDLAPDYIHAVCEKRQGNRIYLDFPSVGATENIIMMASLTPGETTIENAAKEPEIVNLASFLNAMGAKIRGTGTDVIRITGVDKLKGVRFSSIPDRIEAGTYMLAAAATGGEVLIENVIPQHIIPVIAKLQEMGVSVEEVENNALENSSLLVKGNPNLKPVNIKTMPYPGFPTDMQSPMLALLAMTPGRSTVKESVFENRFRIINELQKMGAEINVESRMALVDGVNSLHGATVSATDLRAGAALIIAGCAAEGETIIEDAVHIFRGYERVTEKFRALGARIEEI